MAEPKIVNASLQIDRGTYVVRGRVFDPVTGETRQRSKSTRLLVKDCTKRKAERAMKEIIKQWTEEANAEVIHSDPPFKEYVDRWLEKKRLSLKGNTIRAYEDNAKLHILPALGEMKVRHMKLSDLQSFYADLLETLSVSSIKKIHVVVSGALLDAVRDGIIQTDFSAYVEFPKGKKFEGAAYSLKQVAILLDAAEKAGEPLHTAVMLAACYGLRRSEICGLRWDDINFDAGYLTISNTIVQSGDQMIEAAQTKTAKSHRRIVLIRSTIPHLLALKQKQLQTGVHLGKVCVWPDGKAVRPDFLTHKISKLIERNGLPHIRVHDLRHTAASLLAAKATPKQVQEFLGHSDISTTMDIYTHLADTERIATSNIMDGIMSSLINSKESCSESCSES